MSAGSWIPIVRLIEMLMDIYLDAKRLKDQESMAECERVMGKWAETRDWFLSLGPDGGGDGA